MQLGKDVAAENHGQQIMQRAAQTIYVRSRVRIVRIQNRASPSCSRSASARRPCLPPHCPSASRGHYNIHWKGLRQVGLSGQGPGFAPTNLAVSVTILYNSPDRSLDQPTSHPPGLFARPDQARIKNQGVCSWLKRTRKRNPRPTNPSSR